MKTRICSILITLIFTTQARAGGGCPPSEGIGVFFDANGQTTTASQVGFVPQPFYIIATKSGPISGWETQVTFSDNTVIVLETNFNPPTIVNVGSVDNHIVGLGGCFGGESESYVLVQYQVIWLSTLVDGLICLEGSTPSSFSPSGPGYLSCNSNLVAAPLANIGGGYYPNGCAVLNPTVYIIATEETSWGSLKSSF